jgi:3D (Asp-Asp-Asp) domain-containing protein
VISSAVAQTSDETVGGLEERSTELDASYRETLSNLVAVDSEVSRYSEEIESTTARQAEVRDEIAAHQEQVEQIKQQLAGQTNALAERLVSTYKSDDVGYLEVVLDSGDFSDFLNRMDMITIIAEDDRRLIDSINEAKRTEEENLTALAQKQEEVDSLIVELSTAQSNLVSSRDDQQRTISELEVEMQDNQNQLAQVRAQAAAIETKMNEIQDSYGTDDGSADESEESAPVAGGSSMSMTATAYCLTGNTATGMPVGRGIIAVDPSVIPLGSKVHVSGYGDAIAADVGGAINGNIIDVWLPCEEAYAWGTRTVTVTVY